MLGYRALLRRGTAQGGTEWLPAVVDTSLSGVQRVAHVHVMRVHQHEMHWGCGMLHDTTNVLLIVPLSNGSHLGPQALGGCPASEKQTGLLSKVARPRRPPGVANRARATFHAQSLRAI